MVRLLVCRVLAWCIVLCVPGLLITSNVVWAFNEERLYVYSINRFNVSDRIGVPEKELNRISREVIAYWRSDQDQLDITLFGRPAYSVREITHMQDVKHLVGLIYKMQWLLGLALGVSVVLSILLEKTNRLVSCGNALIKGGLATGGLVLAVSLIGIIAFPWLFTLFHRISFSNDFWLLDPRKHLLVQMFPQRFWFEATLFLGLASALEGVALAGSGWALSRAGSLRRVLGEFKGTVGDPG